MAQRRKVRALLRNGYLRERKIGPPGMVGRRILWTYTDGKREYSMHATKGLRVTREPL